MMRQMFCDKPGAVFVARPTRSAIITWPAVFGIQKHDGCVEFHFKSYRGYGSKLWSNSSYHGTLMSDRDCLTAFYDCPEEEEAWLVTPKGKDWLWERVDGQLKLL